MILFWKDLFRVPILRNIALFLAIMTLASSTTWAVTVVNPSINANQLGAGTSPNYQVTSSIQTVSGSSNVQLSSVTNTTTTTTTEASSSFNGGGGGLLGTANWGLVGRSKIVSNQKLLVKVQQGLSGGYYTAPPEEDEGTPEGIFEIPEAFMTPPETTEESPAAPIEETPAAPQTPLFSKSQQLQTSVFTPPNQNIEHAKPAPINLDVSVAQWESGSFDLNPAMDMTFDGRVASEEDTMYSAPTNESIFSAYRNRVQLMESRMQNMKGQGWEMYTRYRYFVTLTLVLLMANVVGGLYILNLTAKTPVAKTTRRTSKRKK